jgi:hypothetical protein
LDENDIKEPYISAFVPFVDPERCYGIEADLLPPHRGVSIPLVFPQRYNPQPGEYIISASTLRGLQVADPEMYNWFWHRDPEVIIAGAMLHYSVPESKSEPTWVAQCSNPVTPLPQNAIQELFGLDTLRTVTFDCENSWLFPQGGSASGWYILHTNAVENKSKLSEEMLARTILTFEQDRQSFTPRHKVYYMDETEPAVLERVNVVISPSDWTVKQAHDSGKVTRLPVNVGSMLQLTGIKIFKEKESITLWTMWNVNKVVDVPISLMAHLLDDNNNLLMNSDGFGIPFTSILPGDVFVQQHILNIQELASEKIWIQTGVYRLDTFERFKVNDGSSVVGDRILIDVQ